MAYFIRGGSLLLLVLLSPAIVLGESPAPTVHWGGLGYPDQYTSLTTGLTVNRFTEFDNTASPTRYDSTINNTFGLNFISLSWSKHWGAKWDFIEDLSSNITLGIGPTADQPSKWVQNELHKNLGFGTLHENTVRTDTDSMVDVSLTGWNRWLNGISRAKDWFGGVGLSGGTLYQELYGRTGIRRWQPLPDWENPPFKQFLGPLGVRVSGMARYSRLFDGAVLHSVKPSALVEQASASAGSYGTGDEPPTWEMEFAMTWDSGLFVNGAGQSRKEVLGSVALTIGYFRFETWNDLFNHKDKGPTGGASMTIDLCRCGGLRVLCYP